MIRRESAQILGLQALAFVAADEDLLLPFLAQSGLGAGELRDRAEDPDLLGAVVDFLLADRDTYREALRNPIFLTVDGEKIPIARPESLIEMKKISNRPQDLLDISALKETLEDQAEQ